jgi:Cys-tRNA(Pro) deacylase
MTSSDSVDRVRAAAQAAGLTIDVITYPEGTRTAVDAAAAVGVDVAQIVKSLVFMVDRQPAMVLVSGVNQVDVAKLAKSSGGGRIEQASADTVRRATGFAIGGVAPIGLIEDLPVYFDRTLLSHDVVFAAAGRPDSVFSIHPQDLARVTGAIVWALAAD